MTTKEKRCLPNTQTLEINESCGYMHLQCFISCTIINGASLIWPFINPQEISVSVTQCINTFLKYFQNYSANVFSIVRDRIENHLLPKA